MERARRVAAWLFSILIVLPQTAAAQGAGAVGGAAAGSSWGSPGLSAGRQAAAAPPAVAAVVEFTAPVEVTAPGSKKGELVRSIPFELEPGAGVRTGPLGSAVIRFHDLSQVRLDHDSVFTLRKESERDISLWLESGKIWAEVSKVPGRLFGVATPESVAAVRGTKFSVEVLGSRRSATEVYEGAVEVQAMRGGALAGVPELLHPGERIEAGGGMMGHIVSFIAISAQASAATMEARRKAIEAAFRKGQGLEELKGEVERQKSMIKGQFERIRKDQGSSRGHVRRAMEKWAVNREIALGMHSSALHMALAQAASSPMTSPASLSAQSAGYMRQFAQADADMNHAAHDFMAREHMPRGLPMTDEKLSGMAFQRMAPGGFMPAPGGGMQPPTQALPNMMQYSSSQPRFMSSTYLPPSLPPPPPGSTCTAYICTTEATGVMSCICN